MTRLMDRLAELELVERQADKDARRVIDIILTSQGKSILEEPGNCTRNAFKETLAKLTDAELKDVSAALSKLQELFSKSL